MTQHYFKFAARVLEHLGEELISSDDVALYELVKNGFDASMDGRAVALVRVDVEYRFDIDRLAVWRTVLEQAGPRLVARDEALRLLLGTATPSDSERRLLNDVLPQSATGSDMGRCLATTNRIVVADTGVGMSAEELDAYFLTIGTTHRLKQLRERIGEGGGSAAQIPTGEKGIGRLSMMRLGREALIRTSKAGTPTEQSLQIDWRLFNADQPLQAQEVPVDLTSIPRRPDSPPSGTTITITDLRSPWDQPKIRDVAQRFLSKFLDPFDAAPRARDVQLSWNGSPIEIPRIGRAFLDAAQNGFRASVRAEDGMVLVESDSWFSTASDLKKVSHRTYSALDFGGISPADFLSVGPFEVELYHYNRRRVRAIPGVATRAEVLQWLDEWSGGLKLYRDGVRVMPYGQAPLARGRGAGVVQRTSDDWLALDSEALRGRGFRVNRIQVVGRVRISRIGNPDLRDQASREGLIDNSASRNLVVIIKALVRHFVSDLDQLGRPQERDFGALQDVAIATQEDFEKAVQDLVDAASSGDRKAMTEARDSVRTCLEALRAVIDDTQLALEERQLNRIEVIELAATGIAAESFAHDLEASIDQALEHTVAARHAADRDSTLAASLTHLRGVLKSLRTQISSIKPGPARHRRRKSEFDLVRLLTDVEATYSARFDRHRIGFFVDLSPRESSFRVSAVEGHVRQVFDNLIRNSIYWLRETQTKDATATSPAEIRVLLDARSSTVAFMDNGIGIAPEDSNWVFGRFNSRRERGRGLGLYISRELCEFNGIRLELDPQRRNRWGRLSTFLLDFGSGFLGAEK